MRNRNLYNALAIAAASASMAAAQSVSVPGRDLLAYPVGLIAESGALPNMLGLGTYNPAAAWLPDGARWRLAAGSMNTAQDAGASAQTFGASARWRAATISLAVTRAGVAGLVRTDSDPLTVEDDIAYYTLVTSLGVAYRASPHVTLGAATRYWSGRLDTDARSRAVVDVGAVVDHLTRFDARVGASTFLFSPGGGAANPPTWLAAADARVAGRDSLREVRVGVSTSTTAGRPSEDFVYGSARIGIWELRGGPVRTTAYGASNLRGRLALAVHYAGYAVGLAREETPSGLAPTYQFVLSSAGK
ncbi:MAG TPA: hypothetical protein VG916_09890 [Gemmatimonadaceae bacterium]|nr:hypothetical protein [Gemmatimonadaceae bacterium]